MDKTSLGDRMKRNYESVSQTRLLRRTPVIIRLDGKAFHTFTKGMRKPFDDELMGTMMLTTRDLVKNIEGCEFGYTQSDEISLLLTDYSKLETQAWFEYKVQKICSVAASMCTGYFNTNFFRYYDFNIDGWKLAFFDARVFNIPKEEVVNYFLWRQRDATRNSIQSVGQAHFSHKQLHKKSCNEIQDMLWKEKDINWNDLEVYKKRGTCVYKLLKGQCEKCKWLTLTFKEKKCSCGNEITFRSEYVIDKEIPIFTQDSYIQEWVDVDKE